jgi:hypothetical protein
MKGADSNSICTEILKISWKPLLNVLSNLMRSTLEESNIQMLLNSYQNFIGVCGALSSKGISGNLPFDARDGFLESLCTFCLTQTSSVDSKNYSSVSTSQMQAY